MVNNLERYPLIHEANNIAPPTHEFFTTNCKSPDLSTYLSFHNYNSPNTNILFNTKNSSPADNMVSDHQFNCSTLPNATFSSMSNSILSTTISPLARTFNINKFQNWEACTISSNGSNNSNGTSNSIELQSNCSFFDNNAAAAAFAWGSAGTTAAADGSGKPEREEIKWSEYLQTPFSLGVNNNTIENNHHHHQIPPHQELYDGETKAETQFMTQGSWLQNQTPQTSLQTADLYSNNNFQRLPAVFGQFS